MRYATTRRSTTRVGAGVVRSTPPPSPEGEGGLEPPLTQQTETPQYSTLLSNHHQQKLADLSPTPPGFRTTPATPTATPFLGLTHRRRQRQRRILAEEVEEGVGATA